MLKLLNALAGLGLMTMVAGCQMMQKPSTSNTAGDVCPHCPGIQAATADNKCETCNADVSKK